MIIKNLTNRSFAVPDIQDVKQKMLRWANQFDIFCFLDNAGSLVSHHRVDCLLAAGAEDSIEGEDLAALDAFLSRQGGWCFGHLSYDLKNAIHQFRSTKKDPVGFPPFFFFKPRILLELQERDLIITAEDPEDIFLQIQQSIRSSSPHEIPSLHCRLSMEEYRDRIRQLQQHIVRGDCYEINFCLEFFTEGALIDPVSVFERLVGISPNPFSALYRLNDKYLICASPERYLTKKRNLIYSQPMKGTIRRDPDPEKDRQLKEELMNSAKDRSENVMVVDMVRNDLTQVCRPATVRVEELFGVYSYPQVHQMISTVSGELEKGMTLGGIIRATFPMGSMTGAPKHRVMELIDTYETSARGIFSGSVGYIDPRGDFDFNVVIRSIMYRASTGYLSYQLGSGITFYSDPQKEWEECLLKGTAIKKVLSG